MHFADTNVLLYSACADPADAEKASQADSLLMSADLVLSVQVLQEFYIQATRPSRRRKLSHDQAIEFISSWLRFPVQAMTVPVLEAALAAKARWQLPTGTLPSLKPPAPRAATRCSPKTSSTARITPESV